MGTPRKGRGAKTMEAKMTKKSRRSSNSPTTAVPKAKVAAPRRRQSPRTKKQIALSLLERAKGASIAEMQNAMGWQAHSVRGLSACDTTRQPPSGTGHYDYERYTPMRKGG